MGASIPHPSTRHSQCSRGWRFCSCWRHPLSAGAAGGTRSRVYTFNAPAAFAAAPETSGVHSTLRRGPRAAATARRRSRDLDRFGVVGRLKTGASHSISRRCRPDPCRPRPVRLPPAATMPPLARRCSRLVVPTRGPRQESPPRMVTRNSPLPTASPALPTHTAPTLTERRRRAAATASKGATLTEPVRTVAIRTAVAVTISVTVRWLSNLRSLTS